MAIIIQNIDKSLREKGKHLYQLRINNQVICEFTHNREDSLSQCLMKAAAAARSASFIKSKRFKDCSPHPYVDMICQWAHTGQPVWVRFAIIIHEDGLTTRRVVTDETNFPNWNIPGAEYSFTPFEDEVNK